MKQDQPGELDLPKDFDVEESDGSSNKEEHDIVNAGYVETWQQLVFFEKARVRSNITRIVITVWAICTTVSLIRFIMTGDVILLGSPALLMVPLQVVLKFYFKSD